MSPKTAKATAQKRLRKAMKKRAKDKERRKTALKSGAALSENAVQHQMLSEFGNAQNFLKNVLVLAELMRTDEDLKTLRFTPDAVYAYFDLAADRAPLADAYEKRDDFGGYHEDHAEFWREKCRTALKDLVTEEFVERCAKVFKKLMLTKRGFKREYRAVLAGHLLVQSHTAALSPTQAPLEDNNLWELILLATVKENPRELPPVEDAPAVAVTSTPSTGEEKTAANTPDTGTPAG
jgi:hypothetical protein